MSLVEQINNEIKEAMKARNEDRLRALRSIKSAFLLAGTESGNKDISDEIAIKAIQKLAKQRKDSITVFTEQNRLDLSQKEEAELRVLESFLPPALSEDEIISILTQVISDAGASGMKDLGKVMPLAIAKMAGRADGALVAAKLKQLLNN
jgi:uncharacterized protein YqeY